MSAFWTAFTIGAGIGLFVVATVHAYRVRRIIAQRQLPYIEGQWFVEDGIEIPKWVNQAPPKVIRIQDLIDELNFDLWESELEETDR